MATMFMKSAWNDTRSRRAELRAQPDCQFVDAEMYCRLIASTRRLWREDDSQAQLRGLFDPDTGERFFIEEEKITQYCAQRPAP